MHSLPWATPVGAAPSGCGQPASGILTAAVCQAESRVGRACPPDRAPSPVTQEAGPTGHIPSPAALPCPALLLEGSVWPTGPDMLSGGGWEGGQAASGSETLELPHGTWPTETAAFLTRPRGWVGG